MTDREIMQQALDALEIAEVDGNCCYEATELLRTLLTQPAPQPEQEPVAWGVFDHNLHDMFFTKEDAQEMVRLKGDGSTVKPLYTTPPQRKPLTDEWIHRTTILMGFNPEWTTEIGIAYAIVRAAEAAHGIKENK